MDTREQTRSSYRQGDKGEYYIPEIIRSLQFFNCKRYTSTRHPNTLYRNQKTMLEQFKLDLGIHTIPDGPS